MKKRILAVLLGIGLAATSLLGCGGSDSTKEDAATDAEAEKEEDAEAKEEASDQTDAEASGDKVIKWAINGDKSNVYWSELISRFEEEYPEYTLEIIEATGNDQWAKLSMMMQSPETCPDVIAEDGFMVKSDAAAGYLYPLDDFAANWDEFDNYYDNFVEAGKGADGKLYGIFCSTDTMVIWYNMELFEGAGIETPWQPETWDDIIEAGVALKETYGGTVEDFIPMYMHTESNGAETTSMRTFQVLYNSTGGELYDTETGKWVYDKENLLKVYKFIDDVCNTYEIGAPDSVASATNANDIIQNDYLPNGKCGMFFWGSWVGSSWLETGAAPWPEAVDTMGVAAVPSYDGDGLWTICGGWTWAIPANAPNKENAEFFLEWICSYDQQILKSDGVHGTDLNVRSDITGDPSYGADEATFMAETSEYLPYATFRPAYEGYSTVSVMYEDIVEALSFGTYTPDEAAEAFYNELVRLVGEDMVLVVE